MIESTIGIIFVAYSPLGSPGRLEKEDDDVNVLEDETVKAIAATHKATTAQVNNCLLIVLYKLFNIDLYSFPTEHGRCYYT